MADVTDKQLDKSRKDLEDLRAEVEEARTNLVKSEASRNNAATKATYDAEMDRLRAELNALKDAHKISQTVDVALEETNPSTHVVDGEDTSKRGSR